MGELSDHLENALASSQDFESDNDEDNSGDEEWADDDSAADHGAIQTSTNRTFKQTELSRLIGLNGFDLDEDPDEDEEDDPDALADPLYRVNLRQYLTEFIGEFAKQPYFMSHFAQHLNIVEKKALENIGMKL